jgi:hypothetical protein
MSYIFAVIGISVLNSLRMLAFPLLGKVIINLIIIITPFILEEFLLRNRNESYRILYENLDLLRQGKTQELLQDLSTLTGRNVQRYKVLEVDYKKKISELEVFYKV